MSKKAPLKAAPTGDTLSPEEQKFFDTGGEEGGTTPADDTQSVSRETSAPEDTSNTDAESDVTVTDAGKTDATTAQQNKPQKMVPHQALHESREQTKAEKAARQELENRYKTLEQRTNLLLENFAKAPPSQDGQQQTAPKTTLPDPDNDPLGYLLATVKGVAERQDKIDGNFQQQSQQSQQMTTLRNLQDTALAQEEEFRTETPDYDAASQYVQKTRSAELDALGYNPAEVRELLKQEAYGIAARMIQQGKNPAKAIYDMAMARGYTPAASEAENQAGEQTNVAAAVERNSGKLKNVQNGQRQTATLSQARGSAPSPMSAQKLMEMTDADFETFRKNSPKEFRNLMGA